MVKYAFTLIELVFAIVVIGISVVSLPMMIQVTSKNTDNSLVQEAIFAAATKLNEAVTYRWDENSIEPVEQSSSEIINTSAVDCNNGGQRLGFIAQPKHRKCLNDLTVRPSVTLGPDGGDLDDLDDVKESGVNLFSSGTGADSYKKAYTSTIKIEYADFGTVTAASKNIKKITIDISDDNGLVTSLSTYSANIGEIDYFKGSY